MKMIKPGGKTKGICYDCEAVQSATYIRKDLVVRQNKKITVRNILTIVCDKCSAILGFSHESVPTIKEAIENQKDLEPEEKKILLDNKWDLYE